MLLSPTIRRGNYTSEQTHVEYNNGKKRTKTQRVVIRGKEGYKEVTVVFHGKRKTSRKKLSKKEIACIQRCEFVPGLFMSCESCIR
jgi:hypothetical protein